MRIIIVLLAVWVTAMIGYLAYEQLWTGGSGTVVVVSDPPGAEILLDLRPTSLRTDTHLANVPAGEHSVTVKLDGHLSDPFVQVVKVRSGKIDTVVFRLNPLAQAKPIPHRITPLPEPSSTSQPDTLLARLLQEQADERSRTQSEPPAVEATESAPGEPPPPVVPRDTLPPPIASPTGTIEVSSSVPGAAIVVNGQHTGYLTPANLDLSFGMYDISLQLTGYKSDPGEHSVRVSRANSKQFVFFTLAPLAQKEIVITTDPVPGDIFVDSVRVGNGSAIVPHDFGVYHITFGDLPGYHTPDPLRLSITPSKPRPEVQGVYVREFAAAAVATASGTALLTDNARVTVGVYTEAGGLQPSAEGPRVRDIPGATKKGWEFALGDPNLNPPGEDYLEFSFELPPDLPADLELQLRLYLYRSPRRYPLSLGGKSELIVTVNGRSFLPAYAPKLNTDAVAQDRFEQWSLQGLLQPGANRIVVRSAPSNTVYHYLWKLEVR